MSIGSIIRWDGVNYIVKRILTRELEYCDGCVWSNPICLAVKSDRPIALFGNGECEYIDLLEVVCE